MFLRVWEARRVLRPVRTTMQRRPKVSKSVERIARAKTFVPNVQIGEDDLTAGSVSENNTNQAVIKSNKEKVLVM